MRAPEKIYICNLGSELSYDWSNEHCYESDIEYVRTDAFIDKAKVWFDEIDNGTQIVDIEAFFNAFKNYMKGE